MVAAFKSKNRENITVVSVAGDGTISDIAFNKVSAAAERNDNMIQICIDNEAYMNTGIQKSGLTPFGAWTTTTPLGNRGQKKQVPMIIAQHNVPYVATVSAAYPQDLKEKIKKAKEIKGFRYIHSFTPCPTGWRFDPSKSIEIGRLALQTWSNPLWEVNEGVFRLTMKPRQKPVKEYIKAQDRFRRLSDEQIELIQNQINSRKEKLLENDGKNILL
jgi:pyruvate ferredoxin oxidoreductase beta subunit